MAKTFDKELYVKEDFIKEFLKTHEGYWRGEQITMEESLTNFINSILDDRLSIINDKCASCVKADVCKGRAKLGKLVAAYCQDDPLNNESLFFSISIATCSQYLKKIKE